MTFTFLLNEGQSLVRETISQWADDKAFKMSAALSYYTIFSLVPLIMILIALVGLVYGEDAAKGHISEKIQAYIGPEVAHVIEILIRSSSDPATGFGATILGTILLLAGSIGAFLELQGSLNIIWGAEVKPGRVIMEIIRVRLVSFAMILATGFLFIASIALSILMEKLNIILRGTTSTISPLIQMTDNIFSFFLFSFLFAMIFKYLPDVKIQWKYVWIGAACTSLCLVIGNYIIEIYLEHSALISTFGAAGSLVVLLTWVNYSALILYLGAEFTQVYRNRYNPSALKPKRNALIIKKVSQLVKDSILEQQPE